MTKKDIYDLLISKNILLKTEDEEISTTSSTNLGGDSLDLNISTSTSSNSTLEPLDSNETTTDFDLEPDSFGGDEGGFDNTSSGSSFGGFSGGFDFDAENGDEDSPKKQAPLDPEKSYKVLEVITNEDDPDYIALKVKRLSDGKIETYNLDEVTIK